MDETMGFDPYSSTASLVLKGADVVTNWLAGREQAEQQRKAMQALLAGIDKAEGFSKQGAASTSAFYNPYAQQGLQAWGQLPALQQRLASGEFSMPELEEFQYDRPVSDFLDPSMAYQMQQGQKAIEGSAAANYNLISGKTLRDLQKHSQGMAQQDWGNAYNRQQADKAFVYNDMINRFNNRRANIADRYNRTLQMYNQQANLANTGYNAMQNQANINQNLYNQQAGYALDRGNVGARGAQIPGAWQQFANASQGIGNLLSSGVQYGRDLYNYTNQPQATNVGTMPQQVYDPYNPNMGNFGTGASYGTGGYMNPSIYLGGNP